MEFFPGISGWAWGLAAAVPIGIVLLYFLRLKRKPLRVPSTMLWKKSIEDLRVNAFWQRLRRNLLLFLQLLAVGLLLLALAGPTMFAHQSGRRMILLLDQSASMSARDGGEAGASSSLSRLDAARAKALAVIDQMHTGDAAMVLSFSDAAKVASSYTADGAALRRAVEGIEQTARGTDPREALAIAGGLANPQRAGEEEAEAVPAILYLFSDGGFAPVRDASLGNLDLRYAAMGNSGRNLAIVALSVRASAARPDRREVFARVKNFHDQPLPCTAELSVNDQVVDLQRLDPPPGEEQAMSFRLPAGESAVVALRLLVEDELPLDNQAWLVIDPPRRARVLVVGASNPVLKAALETESIRKVADVSFAGAEEAERAPWASWAVPSHDLYIFDRVAPRAMPAANAWMIDALPTDLASLERTVVQAPAILHASSAHPVLRFLELGDVHVSRGFVVPLPRGANPLIETDRGVLLFTAPRGVHTDLVQTFPFVDDAGAWRTDWPLRISFPLFVLNVLRSLGGAERQAAPSVRPGEPVRLRFGARGESGGGAVVETPDGRRVPLTPSPRGGYEFLATERLGVYTARFGDAKERFAVNLFDERESAIRPAATVEFGSVEASDQGRSLLARWDFWRYAATAAFLLLLFEWYIYNRRVYV